MKSNVYTHEQLYSMQPQKWYPSEATEAGFLLGGIGTGNITLSSRGELKDWELFNRPGKGDFVHYSFFSIWAKEEDCEPVAKVLESKFIPPYTQAHGYHSGVVAGLPRMDHSQLKGEYPFANLIFEDSQLPVDISLEAFTPFIPLNEDDSGIPSALFRYKAVNKKNRPVDVTIAGSFTNLAGFEGYDVFENMKYSETGMNEYRQSDGLQGIYFSSPRMPSSHPRNGSMALLTDSAPENVTHKATWLTGGWWDGVQDFWDDFSEDGQLIPESVSNATESAFGPQGRLRVGSLGVCQTLQPGEEAVFEFVLSWYFPNRVRDWDEDAPIHDGDEMEMNYYGTMFQDAWDAGTYLLNHKERLEQGSRDFHRALFSSTLPDYVIDALASNITVLRSPTCFRIKDGTFLGFEGSHAKKGSCEGTCTHVWNYAQTLAFLFPKLERSARIVEFELETDDDGQMAFRTWQIFGKPKFDMLPATDGQLGTIIRLYREWKISGDNEFLHRLWDKASKALDFAFKYWDSDGDYVLDNRQHNTYDIEFYGPSSLTNSMFFAALKAGAEMAEYVGDAGHAAKYRQAYELGSKKMDALLWGGEYYVQLIDNVDEHRYQYGTGCLSDQLFGQMLAHVVGLGYVLPENHVKQAMASIYAYNFKTDFYNHFNTQRSYALNDDKGLVLCSWPKGGRPKLPFVYSQEVWSGIEYQVAAHLIYEGFLEEGLTIVKAVRERYDGYRRNPWDEVECGHHYSRSTASWAVLLALSGFKLDMNAGTMSFQPVINKDHFSTFWSCGKAWGIYKQYKDSQTGELKWEIEVLYGTLEGIRVNEH
ncbi:GH116 family glycosyl-hydrolase [Neobacillus jeddahensis]|uniref:GH116 family glycosyl-hydrolase n=1 Tax=Neobacillus jeddahensis TaxID=1461580 RepID=UPI00069449B2|nr:GH116 family glycosyl-hydrolase [Neobacillus jeddahensis]